MCIPTFSKFETAAAAAENDCDALPLFHGEQLRTQLCSIQSLTRSDTREWCRARSVLAFFCVDVFEGIDAAHLAGNLNRKWRRIERRNPPNTATCVSQTIPQFRARIPERSDA